MAYTGLYNADGQISTTVVNGSTYTGLYSADGNWNIVINDGTVLRGRFHPCGALNAVVVTDPFAPATAANGSQNVILNSQGGYSPTPITGGLKTNGFYNFNVSNLSNWSTAVTAQTTGVRNSRILCAGDSTTAGVGGSGLVPLLNNDIAFSYPTQLSTLLGGGWENVTGNHNAVSGGTTLPNFDFRFTRLDAEWANTTNGTLGGVMNGASNVIGTTMIWTPTVAIDTLEVYFARFSTTGIITVTRDGGTPVDTVNTAGATGTGKQTLTMPLGVHALEFVGAATAQYIIGLIAYNSANKIPLVVNAGAMAWTAGGLNGSGFNQNQWPYPTGVTTMTPDVVIESIGINDMTGGVNLATYGGALSAFSGKMLPSTDLIFMSFLPCLPGGAIPSYAGQQTYVDTMKAQAIATNRPFIDIWGMAGGVYQPSLMFDTKHPNGAGYAYIAAAVKKALTPGFNSR